MKNMKKLSLAVIAISTAMLSTSCLREENFGKADSKFISLKVSTEGIAETKAGHVAEPLEVVDLSQDGLDLFLYGSVKVNKMSPFAPMTKADSPYGKDDAANVKKFDIQMNNTAGYADREERDDFWYIYSNGEKLTWEYETAPSYYLAYYPQNEEGAATASFVNSTKVSYAGDGEKDFLVAYTEHTHDHANYPVNSDNYVSLTFKHPLALVNFHVAEGLRIPYIIIHNAATAGDIEVINNGESFKCTPDKLGDVWLQDAGTQSVGDLSIYLMPGKIGADDINVTFYIDEDGDNEVDKILSTKNLGTSAWESGYIYNYTIANADVDDVVDVEIADEDEIVIENEFTNAVFLRAAVVANWVDAKGRIVEAWTPADDPITFNTAVLGWKLNNEEKYGADGYFYHVVPVLGYQASDALIESITKNSNKDGLKLQVSVAVQAVGYDHDKANAVAAWGEGIKDLIGGLQ